VVHVLVQGVHLLGTARTHQQQVVALFDFDAHHVRPLCDCRLILAGKTPRGRGACAADRFADHMIVTPCGVDHGSDKASGEP
jgi:hypothetical protein